MDQELRITLTLSPFLMVTYRQKVSLLTSKGVLFSDMNIEEHSLWLPASAESFMGNLMIDLKPIVLFELSRCYHFNTTSISNTTSEISLLQLYVPHHALHPFSQNE